MEVKELQEEISFLKKRIEVLEKRDKRRRAGKILSIIFKLIFYLAIIGAIWYGYNYVKDSINNIPSILNEKIQELNPLR